MATGLTAMTFVLDRKQGLLDRSLVAGEYLDMFPNNGDRVTLTFTYDLDHQSHPGQIW